MSTNPLEILLDDNTKDNSKPSELLWATVITTSPTLGKIWVRFDLSGVNVEFSSSDCLVDIKNLKDDDRVLLGKIGLKLMVIGKSGGVESSSTPAGSIMAWSSNTIPNEWAECNGQELSRSTDADLFAIIGTTFGAGNGSTTFNVPNLSGRVLVGLNLGDAEFNTLGKTGGAKTHLLTANQSGLRAHTHPQNVTANSGGPGVRNDYSGDSSGVPYSQGINTNANAAADAAEAHNNIQPYSTTRYIIKRSGGIGSVSSTVDAALTARISAVEDKVSPLDFLWISTGTHSQNDSWVLAATLPEWGLFNAGSKLKIFYHIPYRNNSDVWGGLYTEPQIRLKPEGGIWGEWRSFGTTGYGLMISGNKDIVFYNNTLLFTPDIGNVKYSVQMRFYMKSYDGTTTVNTNNDLDNAGSGTATRMAGDNGNQHYFHTIVEEKPQ